MLTDDELLFGLNLSESIETLQALCNEYNCGSGITRSPRSSQYSHGISGHRCDDGVLDEFNGCDETWRYPGMEEDVQTGPTTTEGVQNQEAQSSSVNRTEQEDDLLCSLPGLSTDDRGWDGVHRMRGCGLDSDSEERGGISQLRRSCGCESESASIRAFSTFQGLYEHIMCYEKDRDFAWGPRSFASACRWKRLSAQRNREGAKKGRVEQKV